MSLLIISLGNGAPCIIVAVWSLPFYLPMQNLSKGRAYLSFGFGNLEYFNGELILELVKNFCFTLYLLICQLKKSGSVLKSASIQNGIFFLMNFQHFLIYLPKIKVTSEVKRYHFFVNLSNFLNFFQSFRPKN